MVVLLAIRSGWSCYSVTAQRFNHWRASIYRTWRILMDQNVSNRRRSLRWPWAQYIQVRHCIMVRIRGSYKSFSRCRHRSCFLIITHAPYWLSIIDNQDCILYALPLSRPCSLPAGTKTCAGRTRCCNWKRPTTHVRRQAASSVHWGLVQRADEMEYGDTHRYEFFWVTRHRMTPPVFRSSS